MGAIDTNYKTPPEQLDPTKIETPLIVTDPVVRVGSGLTKYSSDTKDDTITVLDTAKLLFYAEELTKLTKQVKDLQTRVEILELKALSR